MTNLGAVCGVVRSWSEALRVLQATEPGNPDTSAP